MVVNVENRPDRSMDRTRSLKQRRLDTLLLLAAPFQRLQKGLVANASSIAACSKGQHPVGMQTRKTLAPLRYTVPEARHLVIVHPLPETSGREPFSGRLRSGEVASKVPRRHMRLKLRVEATYDFEGGGVPAKQAGGVAGGQVNDRSAVGKKQGSPCAGSFNVILLGGRNQICRLKQKIMSTRMPRSSK